VSADLAAVSGEHSCWIDPVCAFARLEGTPYALLMHGGGAGPHGRFSYLCAFPEFIIEDDEPVRGFKRLRRSFRPRPPAGEGFAGGYAGLLSYDLGQAFERTPAAAPGLSPWPAVAMGWYGAAAVFDHQAGVLSFRGEAGAARRLEEALFAAPPPAPARLAPGARLEPVWSEARYLSAVRAAHDYVRAGDVFQVNLSHPYRARLEGEQAPRAVFKRLAALSPAAFSACLRLDDNRMVMTNSPERFVQVFPGGRVETRPVKGTRARGSDPHSDARLARELAASAKDRAENLMIVDLMRNDLSRVCAPGSVRAHDLFAVEAYANVHHMVSTVEGKLAAGRDVFDLIAASFPPGSVTGAPKPRAMEIIAELEGESRGPYCGALGWIGADGAADFNVMIRSLACVRNGAGWDAEARSGGAITIDSNALDELEETRSKVSAIRRAIEADDA